MAVEVTVLTSELERIRQDRSYAMAIYTSLLGVAVVIAGGFLAVSNRELTGSPATESWIWAAFAVVPPLIAAFLAWTSARDVIQSYYMREVERRLAALWDHELQSTADELPPTVLETVNSALISNRRGLWQLRVIYWATMLILGTILFVGSIVAAQRIDSDALRWLTSAVVLGIAGVTAHLGFRLMARGPVAWDIVRARAIEDLRSDFPHRPVTRTERRLVWYLLLPRPNDLIIKGVMLHLVAALVGGWLARGHTTWGQALQFAGVSFVSFELLMYQARYMVNDLRGEDEDRRNPVKGKRRRLPEIEPATADTQPRRNTVKTAIVLRGIAAVALAFTLPGSWSLGLLAALVATWVLAVIYESLRRRPTRHGLQRSASPGFNQRTQQVYAVVGLSYAIRAAFGLYLGSEGHISGWLVVAVAVTFYLSGVTTVLMAWALETTLYIGHRDGHDVISQDIGTKDHLLPLARSVGILGPDAKTLTDDDPNLTNNERPHHDKPVLATQARLSLPWNWLFVAASAAAAATGWLGQTGVGAAPALVPILPLALVGAAAGLACVRWPLPAGFATLAVFLAWSCWLWQSHSDFDALFGPFPLTVVVLIYVVTRGMTYLQTVDLVGQVAAGLQELRDRATHIAREIWR